MSAQRVDGSQLGFFSISMPIVWVTAAVLGFALIANWPELFDTAARASPAPAADPAAAYVSSDPPVPEASKVFAGRRYEASQQYDTF